LQTWDELVNEFRALGGTIENVQLGEGPLGRGLFPIDPTRPLLIRIPENLLVKKTDIVFENNVLKVAPNASLSERERRFYEDYYANLSWGVGGRAEVERLFEQAQALPAELRHKLAAFFMLPQWFADPTEDTIQSNFIQSRKIGLKGHDVMMPFIELANHGNEREYEAHDGLILQGAAQDEITVHYGNGDAYDLFCSFGFSAPADFAYSLPLKALIGEVPLLIDRSGGLPSGTDRPGYPKVRRDGALVRLDMCMLGNRRFPRFCRGNFRHALRAAGFREVDETFDRIRQDNQLLFLSLLADLESLEGPMVRTLRQMARFQLQAIAFCFGARETPLTRTP